jgi:hypothetical protein
MGRVSLNRRTFTLGATAAAATALISPGEALEQAQAAATPAPQSTLEQKFQTAMAKLSPAAQAEVQSKIASIFRKYGDRLSEEQKADIRRAMAETQDGLEKMRAFALENSDQPATVFEIHQQEGRR